jgi:hypothetical protein
VKAPSSWPTGRPDPVKKLVDRVSVEVAHLTTYRLSGSHPAKEWTPRECLAVLVPRLETFVREIDPIKESPKLRPAVERLRTLLDSTNPKIRQSLDTACSTTLDSTARLYVWGP